MEPKESASVFVKFAESRGVSLTSGTPRELIDLMFSFYQSVASSNCAEIDGDMLLFQWGTNDWGNGKYFGLNITRQFIEKEFQDDDAISQLSLTLKFDAIAERENLGIGNRWCGGPTELESFRKYVLGCPPFVALADKNAVAVELVHNYV